KFANLRLLYGWMYGQSGKKLLFMGSELGQAREWSHERELDWPLLQRTRHAGLKRWVEDLNRVYRAVPALHALDCDPRGFEWIDCHASDESVLAWIRWAPEQRDVVLVACNFTPLPRYHYRLGVPRAGLWRELLNGDAQEYGGSGIGNGGGMG